MKASMTVKNIMINTKVENFSALGGVGRGLMVGCCLALVVSGCTRGSSLNQGGVLPTQQAAPKVTSLKPAPLTPVKKAALEPVTATPPPVKEVAAPIPAEPKVESVKVAKVSPTNGKPVTREALLGSWVVSSGATNCQVFLTLTKWSGGYRAGTRGCAATGISNVAAWDVKGKQVVLVGSSGTTLATLYRSAGERYDGSTTSGSSISLSR
ncbi:MAG: AprI/Inh family metalloprotease inhibitor [Rhizobiaceae bacterium]